MRVQGGGCSTSYLQGMKDKFYIASCKTKVIATIYSFSMQVPVSPADFSKPIFRHIQPLQNPEHAVVVTVIMSHGAVVVVAAFMPHVVLYCCGCYHAFGFMVAVMALGVVLQAVSLDYVVSWLWSPCRVWCRSCRCYTVRYCHCGCSCCAACCGRSVVNTVIALCGVVVVAALCCVVP
jgi:hypothetical protein